MCVRVRVRALCGSCVHACVRGSCVNACVRVRGVCCACAWCVLCGVCACVWCVVCFLFFEFQQTCNDFDQLTSQRLQVTDN
jgi:hypothetical protein